MREIHSPTGRLHVILSHPESGQVVVDRWVDNLVTTAGRELLAQLITGVIPGIAKIDLAVGGRVNGEVPPDPYPPASPSDLALHLPLRRFPTESEIAGIVPNSDPPRLATAISAVMPAEIGGEVLVLREAGLVMTKGGGDEGAVENEVLYNRVVFATITKDPELQMTLTWEVIF